MIWDTVITMGKHMRKTSGDESWTDGHGFLVFHVLLENGLVAGCSPQGIIAEKTWYGMRMYHKRGVDNHGSAMLFAFVFRVGQEGIVIVSPHLIFLCFMFALPLLAVAVSVWGLFARGLSCFVGFGVPTLIMVLLWQLFFAKFILENVYCGQEKYDHMCRRFIAALGKPSSITIASMKRVGFLTVFASLAWRYMCALILSRR